MAYLANLSQYFGWLSTVASLSAVAVNVWQLRLQAQISDDLKLEDRFLLLDRGIFASWSPFVKAIMKLNSSLAQTQSSIFDAVKQLHDPGGPVGFFGDMFKMDRHFFSSGRKKSAQKTPEPTEILADLYKTNGYFARFMKSARASSSWDRRIGGYNCSAALLARPQGMQRCTYYLRYLVPALIASDSDYVTVMHVLDDMYVAYLEHQSPNLRMESVLWATVRFLTLKGHEAGKIKQQNLQEAFPGTHSALMSVIRHCLEDTDECEKSQAMIRLMDHVKDLDGFAFSKRRHADPIIMATNEDKAKLEYLRKHYYPLLRPGLAFDPRSAVSSQLSWLSSCFK